MAKAWHSNTDAQSKPLVITRTLDAPRLLVFKAWSTAEHIKRWFCPAGYSVPEATVDFRVGGVFAVCMRSPEGRNYWSRGHFVEISRPDKLVITMSVVDGDAAKFTAYTTVTFENDPAGTRMTVHQTYEIHDQGYRSSVDGAPEGWRTTLDKLGEEVARLKAAAASRSVEHDVFTLERTYAATTAEVFHALTVPAAKARWFVGGEGYQVLERSMDVRPGGRERLQGRWSGGMVSTFDATYLDVVRNERLVYVYEMHLDDRKISVSLATLELQPAPAGTRLLLTEQGAFLDGYEDGGSRAQGTGFLLDKLGAALVS